jgi:uncharacterized cupredoxin-like copper-binding protein
LTTTWKKAATAGLVTSLIVMLAACGSDSEPAQETSSAGGGSSVGVELQEFGVGPDPSSADEGEVTFELENTGEETHEFVVIKTDLSAVDLPTVKDGSVDEEGKGMEVVDEVEEIPSGESRNLTVDLDAGNYVLICNIVEEEDGETVSHYQQGMRTPFMVE